ncbi:TPRXL [Biomphalaria pfeifferi]|uniref:TPRXL n=1 Tax=Biomphalaria pfeifferi TaxID=112525 RepID=A0AAD8FGE2_BIOPF|nr:TPRXL [Biomphalaria pfeifferi]
MKLILVLLSVFVTGAFSTSVMCSLQNQNPCTNFPELCSANGARCEVKGPCEYECVCPVDAKGCIGTQQASADKSDVRHLQSESLLIFSPDLFNDFPPVKKVPVNKTAAPHTTTTAAVPTTTASPSTTTSTTTSKTTGTTTVPASTTTSTITTTTQSNAPIFQASMVERHFVKSNEVQDDFDSLVPPQPENVTSNDDQNANSSDSFPGLIAILSTPSPTAQNVKPSSVSPSQDLKQILETIKSSFQLLTSHLIGSENQLTPTIQTSTPASNAAAPSTARASSTSAASRSFTTTISTNDSSLRTDLKTA